MQRLAFLCGLVEVLSEALARRCAPSFPRPKAHALVHTLLGASPLMHRAPTACTFWLVAVLSVLGVCAGILSPKDSLADATSPIATAADTEESALRSATETVPRDVFVVLAGGVSLGSYEAGYVATALRFLRENRAHYHLRGIAGTSAGGINALAGAIEYCRVDANDPTRSSVNYDAWMPIAWKMLYEESKVTRGAVFHHDDLRTHGRKILSGEGYTLRPDCDLTVISAVTRDLTLTALNDPQQSIHMVEYLGLRVTADAKGKVVYRQLPPRADTNPRRAALVADEDGIVAPKEVLNLLMATAAFPAAFPRVEMTVIEGSSEHPQQGVLNAERSYYDGGVFENVPARAILPLIETDKGSAPLVLIVDLNHQRVPPMVSKREIAGDLGKLAGTWLQFARARDYASSVIELDTAEVEIWRALQRYPVASEFISAFAGFFDLSFRETDYALGVHDAREDLQLWAPSAAQLDAGPDTPSVNACVHHLLLGGDNEDCAMPASDSMLATLRGLVAAAASRCDKEVVTSMGCAAFREEALRDRLPTNTLSPRHEARLRRAPGKAQDEDFQAFLEELRLGDFQPELSDDWPNLRGPKGRRPEVLWSRLAEDALRQFANKQARPTLSSQVAFETLLSSALPVLPRPSVSALINLNGFETTMSLPLSPRFSADLGVTAEWASRKERVEGWHLFSAGPVARLGWTLSKRQALVSSIADVHVGLLFGPTYPSVVDGDNGPGLARGQSRPNAAAFVGVAPRFILLRRLQVDFPIRTYWLCDTPGCTSFASARPAYSMSFRLGWNWTISPRIRSPKVRN